MKTIYKEYELAAIGLNAADFYADEQKRSDIEKVFGTVAKVVRRYEASFYEGKWYPETARDVLEYKGEILEPAKLWNEKTFFLYLADKPDAEKFATRPRPNKIGAATDKKMGDYLAWLLENEAARMNAEQVYADKKAAFIAELEGLPVVWDRDKKGGRAVMNGIEFVFSFHGGAGT